MVDGHWVHPNLSPLVGQLCSGNDYFLCFKTPVDLSWLSALHIKPGTDTIQTSTEESGSPEQMPARATGSRIAAAVWLSG